MSSICSTVLKSHYQRISVKGWAGLSSPQAAGRETGGLGASDRDVPKHRYNTDPCHIHF